MAAKVHGRADTSDVFGVRRLGKQRSETNPVFYCDDLCRENPPKAAKFKVWKSVCFLYFISFHVGILLRFSVVQTVELQMFSGCPFGMLLSMIMLAGHCQVWNSWTTAGWLVSACRKLPSSWNVEIKMVRRGYPASLVHTSIQIIQTRQEAALTMMLWAQSSKRPVASFLQHSTVVEAFSIQA